MNLFMIAKSNIKKNKSMSITLLALIIVASILLYIGTSIVLNLGTFLEDKNKELNGSDFTVVTPIKYDKAVQSILEKMGDFTQYETVDAISSNATFKNLTLHEKGQPMGCIILNADKKEKISELKIINKGDKKRSNSIILPYYSKVANGYKTGDEIVITYGGHKHKFIIYGFAEDIMFATPSNISIYKCYVFEDEFNKLYKKSEYTQYRYIKTKLEKGTDKSLYSDNFIKNTNDEIPEANNSMISNDIDTMEVGVSIFLIIIMSVLIAFSIIIILIALTVMRFAIVTYIEGNMKNIGSMEALGYTGKELVLGTILQFALITIVSIVIGLIIAISCTGFVTNLVSSTIGLVWNSKINLLAILLNVAVIMTSVVIITYLTSAKLKKITPIVALRDGINTHNFKKNYLPLSKSSFNVNASIGFKALMQNMKQNITIMIIVTLLSFVCVLAFTTNYNFNINNTALLRLIGLEKSHLMVSYEGEDAIKIFDEIGEMKNIKKIVRLTAISMTASMDGREITPVFSVCDDFNKLTIKTIVKGRYPSHDNEIAVSERVLDQLKAEVGDAITLKSNDVKQEYLIVGVTQQMNNLGKCACITEAGMKKINPDYVPAQLYVYLNSSDNIASVIKAIEGKYSGSSLTVYNMEESFDTILESFNGAMVKLCIASIIITLCIITLILYLLIRIKLIKERMRIGVNKAIGYTTSQLILQIILSFCPTCILGAFVGTVLAAYLINPTFSLALSSSGIRNCHLTIDPLLTIITFFAISLFSILITAIVAGSVRKITPRELFL